MTGPDASLRLVDVLTRTEKYLRSRGIDSPRLEAELLLGHVLRLERLKLYLQFDRPMSHEELERLRPLVGRRGKREPFAWILGTTSFHNIDLYIAPGVLVPRPDTETLVEAALGLMAEIDPLFIADIGCGSGAVGLALAAARTTARVYAVDVSEQALAVTRRNVEKLGLTDRVAVLNGSLLDPIPARRAIDWVVSNPPYIPSSTIDDLMPEVSHHEPRLALDGGPDGLDIYRALIPAARARARCGLLVEVGQHQAGRVADLFRKAGFTDISGFKDLAGIDRVVAGRVPGR